MKRNPRACHWSAWTSLGALVFLAGPAGAQEASGYAVDRFEPSERGSEWFVTDSLDFRGHGRPAMGLVLDWARRPLVFHAEDGTSTPLVETQVFGHFGGSIVFWERLRLGASLPVALHQSGQAARIDGVEYGEPLRSGVGDLRLAADLRLLGEYRSPFSLAVGGRAWLPTGDRAAYTSDEHVRLGGHVLAAGEMGEFVYAARVGVNYRGLEERFAGSPLGTETFFAASAGVRILDGALVVGPEVFGSTVLRDGGAFERQATPVEAIVGGHYTTGPWRWGAGIGPGLTRGMGSPAFRGLLSVEYIPEVEVPPPPAPLDTDHDGIVDTADACPREAGVAQADASKHGCPLPADGDQDGILDAQDACPSVPGVESTDPERHGCPAPADTDNDGISDNEDACPQEAGEPSTDPQRHGCVPPPPDTDGDDIIDGEDACPTQAGSPSEDPARHGCAQVKVSEDEIELLQRVEFETNKTDLLAESHEVLRDVARAIKTLPESSRIRVEGHTDNRGWQELNQRLSQGRAEAVVAWLVNEGGIAADRLSATGVGDAKPIAPNTTEEGRQKNRRVEFHIVDGVEGAEGQ